MNMEIGRVLTIDDSLVETQVKVPNIRTYTCNIALEALAEQFLNAPEASLEMRAYLVQTTLPTLVLSLEKLIHEIEQRMLITNNPKEAEQVNYSDSKGDFRASISNSETTLNSPSHSQPDMPVERFDALQWLAQHLFRNNPFYSHCFDQTSSAYVKSMTVVAEGLRQKISDLAASKEAKRISDELARQQEQHRAQLARIERLEETRQIFTSSLGSVFNTWMTSLWREPQGVLSQSELINGFTDVSNNTDIQSTPDLYIKVVNLCKAISTTHNDANIEIPAEHKIFDSTDPLYLLDPADVERWDINLFIKMNLKLMCMWSANELSDFLRALSSTVAAQGTVLTTVYKESLFVPVFKHSEITTVDDWLEELRKVAEPLNLSDHVHGNSACSALKNFCLGEDSPQFRNTADTESISDTNDTIAIAEERFKGFSKGILREFGPDIFRKMMAQLKKEVEEMQKRKEVHLLHVANVLPVPKQNDIDEKEPTAEVKQYTLAQLRECLSQFEDPDGTIQAEYLIKILSAAIEKPDVPGRILTTVSHLRSYAGTLDRVVPDSFVSLVESVCGADVDPLSELTPLLLWALSEAKDSSVMTKKPVESRLNIERIAMKEIKNLDLRTDLSISTACNMFIDIMEAAFQKIYPKKKIFGRISLIETAITKLATGLDKLTDGDEISSNGIIESFMRTVAVSQVLWPTLLGRTANEGSGVDYQITTLQNNLIIKDVSKDATVCLDPFVKCSVELLEENLTVGLMGFR
ncbi:hypothetical protein BASA50_004770 [Batrachochytrium salamandrivorans]|uniref:Uncharacterized protein n=1 Tax=Batrachochytrium salamandrivorans TaxID=1357716 RepID=A0ABQ8FEQ5_9FUNG|nr:hypothetical protein BASA50_004770 [Batrachochytrium salamandrivorans]